MGDAEPTFEIVLEVFPFAYYRASPVQASWILPGLVCYPSQFPSSQYR